MARTVGRSIEAIRAKVLGVGGSVAGSVTAAGLSAACHVILSGLGFLEDAAERNTVRRLTADRSTGERA